MSLAQAIRAAARLELRPMLQLAVPVVIAELAWMMMGVVDTLMVGHVGPEAIGAVGLGRTAFLFVAVGGIGLLLGLDTLVARAAGAGRLAETRQAMMHGVYLACAMALPATLLVRMCARGLEPWGVTPEVIVHAEPYILAVSWAAWPIFLYAALRRYLQAVDRVRPVMIALISANLCNVAANWLLISGNLGAPALGAAGAAWATVISSWYLVALLAFAAWAHARPPLRLGAIDWGLMRRLLSLGLPASAQLLLEVGVFALVTALIGRLDAASLAAHQIALIAASVTYMVPLGLSSAGAVRVGQALGRDDLAAAARAGWTALALGPGFMSVAAVLFVAVPESLIRLFTDDPQVIAIGVVLLRVAAVFQLFDGLQVVATGILRGAGDTRNPMMWNLLGYWIIGLPVGWWLCFGAGFGASGLWIGLSIGLILVGCVLLRVWVRWLQTAASRLPDADHRMSRS